MRLSVGLQMQLSQKQVLAPRMIQSMEILQLPIQALQERIEQEMEENPCLDQKDGSDEEGRLNSDDPSVDNPDAPTDTERELVVEDNANNEDDFERLLNMAENMPNDFDDSSRPSRGETEAEGERKHDAMANAAARPQTLQDYLHDQLSWFDLDADVRRMADRIIYNLDSNGYLKSPLEELLPPVSTELNGDAEAWRKTQLTLAEKALEAVQRLDPPGVGARNLKECLLLQLSVGMPYYEELRKLIADHLTDLEQNRLPQISKATGYSIELIQEVWEELRKLKPKPGADYSDSFVPNVTPDVYVDRKENSEDADGPEKYEIRLENNQIPSLFISPFHLRLLKSGEVDDKARDYIKKKITSAQWLIESIEQRQSTLSKVAQAIVDHQWRFLDDGPEFIEPLKMQQIAEKVGVHVTTVSRAVDDKWMQTPRGIFPMKRFFVGGTTNAGGDEVAWDTVRLKLQEIIDDEDKSKPFSDDALVEQLAEQGITVARRTVTKYRKAMNIPSSRQRREWTRA